MKIRVWLFLLAVCALAQSTEGPTVRFALIPQSKIEDRLRAYPRKNRDREPVLRRLFEESGCKDTALTEQLVTKKLAPNLMCTSAGATDSTIIVGAHFDFVEDGSGVVDNWSGASLLPSLYEGLSTLQRRHTFIFIGFTAEESGMVGSKEFVKQFGLQRERVKAMVNMDTLGLAESEVWASHADPKLVNLLAATAQAMSLPLRPMNVDQVGSTDSESFRERQIPAITIHSLTQETLKILHFPADRIEVIQLNPYYRTYQLVLGYLAVLDETLE